MTTFLFFFQTDKLVIGLADDKTLEEYLPLKGDRIAVKGFCRKLTKDITTIDKKTSLLNSLKRKLLENSDEAHLVGNKNTAKKTRKIELGWLNFDSTTNTYKQVRKPRGGGIRQLNVIKEATREDIIRRATDVFFPEGVSKLGPLKVFRCDLRDSTEDMVSPTGTLEEMFTRTAMQTLRFYLTTTRIVSDTQDLPELTSTSMSYSFPQNVSSPVLSAVSMNLSEDKDFLLDSVPNVADAQDARNCCIYV